MAKKHTHEAFAAWCAEEGNILAEKLGLTQYYIDVCDTPSITECSEENAFSISCPHPYKSASIFWNERTYLWWCKQDRNSLRRYLLHEMLHILVKPLQRLSQERYVSDREVTDATEGLVDHLTNIMYSHLIK